MRRFIFISASLLLLKVCLYGNAEKHQPDHQLNPICNMGEIITSGIYPVMVTQKNSIAISEIVKSYLSLKNALTVDKPAEAAKAGALLKTAFKSFDRSTLNPDQKKQFEELAEDASENAEHISESSKNITHQREHFDLLSKDMYDLVKKFGAGQVLYKIFCPIYNNGKGAFWLSETREIQNPYSGKSISACGTVSEEIK